jgi:hypothetical protein
MDDGDRDDLTLDFAAYVLSLAAQIEAWADALAGEDQDLRERLAFVQRTFLQKSERSLW